MIEATTIEYTELKDLLDFIQTIKDKDMPGDHWHGRFLLHRVGGAIYVLLADPLFVVAL